MLTPAPNERRCTRYVAKHPLRRATPDQKGCNAYGSGAAPPTTSPTADTPSPQTPTVRLGRSHTASTYSPRLRTRGAAPVTSRNTRYVAKHPLRRDAPDQKGCNAYRSGAPPPTTSPTAGTPSRHTTTGSIGRSHTPSKYSHRFRARAAAPDPSHCTRSVAVHPIRRGVMPTDRVQHHFATSRTAETRLDSSP